jgi:propionyl-CoA synthetase
MKDPAGFWGAADIVRELVLRVREAIGPVAAFKTAAVLPRLPKTRSGKILRGTIRRLANGTTVTVPATIEDAGALDEVSATLRKIGYPHR